MWTFVVMPCLNEEKNLWNTAHSLGFGRGKNEHLIPDTYLVIVDNYSSDKTLEIAEQIKTETENNKVITTIEKERGYIPPRRRGNQLVEEFCKRHHVNPHDVLIIQADADTVYSQGYIAQFTQAASTMSEGTLLEGLANYPIEFRTSSTFYVDICQRVDQHLASYFANSEEDIVVDDKTCAYRLSDYTDWGGFIREFNVMGEEIYAETTRLFIRGKSQGAKKKVVEEAVSFHSTRKLMDYPAVDFVTPGYPHTTRDLFSLKKLYPHNLEYFQSINDSNVQFQQMVKVRQEHLIALFIVLPLHIKITIKSQCFSAKDDIEMMIAEKLPIRSKSEMYNNPSMFIADAFRITRELRDHVVHQLKDLRSDR